MQLLELSATEGMDIKPTFAFSTSQTASGALLHHRLRGLPVPHFHHQSHCVHPAKSHRITPKVEQNKTVSSIRTGFINFYPNVSFQEIASDKMPNLEFSRTQTGKTKHIIAIHKAQLCLLCSLQTHLITIKLIIIWDKPKVSKFLLITFFFSKMQINKSIDKQLQANYKN